MITFYIDNFRLQGTEAHFDDHRMIILNTDDPLYYLIPWTFDMAVITFSPLFFARLGQLPAKDPAAAFQPKASLHFVRAFQRL
jgi:hypothetical protein